MRDTVEPLGGFFSWTAIAAFFVFAEKPGILFFIILLFFKDTKLELVLPII